jgi:hypothetical protein
MALSTNTCDYKTWCDYYRDKIEEESGTLQLIGRKQISLYDDESVSYLDNPNSLTLAIAGSEYYFALIPSALATVKVIHHCTIVTPEPGADPIILGLLGNRKGTAQFKEIKARTLTQAMSVPPITRAGVSRLIPTLQEMFATTDATQFTNLDGRDPSSDSTEVLKYRPNIICIHPAIFMALQGTKSTKAADAAQILISLLKSDNATNDGSDSSEDGTEQNEPSAMARQSHTLLVFLWAVTNGFASNITPADPPDTDIMDARQQGIADKLQASPQNRASARESSGDEPRTTDDDPVTGTLTAALISNLNAMSQAQLITQNREDKKRSMLS